MQKMTNITISKSQLFVGIIAVICVVAALLGITANLNFADNQPIVANAATTINNEMDFANAFKTTSTNVSGDFVLGSSFTVSSSHISEATFSGSLDGKGNTITITGTHSASYTNVDKYVGFLCGTLTGRISNLNIVINGVISATATNSKQTSGDYNDGAAYSTTLFIGGIAGKAQNAQLNNVNITIGSSGVVSGIGKDGNGTAETHASGQGSVVGGLFGVVQGGTLNNVSFTNNGSIWARSENLSGGYYYYTYGGIFDKDTAHRPIYLTDSTRADRASSGGLFGEVINSTTTINNFIYSGSGYVGARAYGEGNNNWNGGKKEDYVHNINFAGGIVGYAKGGKIAINGMLYKYNGLVFVAHKSKDGIYYAGTISGRATSSNDVSIKYLWRNPNDGKNSGYGYNTLDNTSNGPTASNLSSTTAQKRLSSGGTVASVATQDSSLTVSISNATETSINSYHDGSQVATGAATISDIKNGVLTIYISVSSPYYISSLYYKTSDVDYTYVNYYEKELVRSATLTGEEYAIPMSCNSLEVHLTTVVKEELYVECAGGKQYNRAGISFTGKPTKDSPGILPNLRWVAIANGNFDSEYTKLGEFGSAIVVSHQNVGTYDFVLYKENADGTLEIAQDGDNLGPNRTNAPSIIYQFDGKSYTYEITQAKLELRAKTGASYSRPYNGETTVLSTDLIINRHYEFYLDDGSLLTDETPSVTIGEGHFYDKYNNKTSAVSTGLTVKIDGFKVSGNYTLSETSLIMEGCAIEAREITVSWGDLDLTYDGSLLYPTATALNTINNDTVTLKTSVYSDEMLLNMVSKTNAGSYWAKVELASTDDPTTANYKFKNGSIRQKFNVLQKELRIAWSNFSEVYNGTTQKVAYSIIDEATNVATGDSIGLTVKYYFDDQSENVSLLNAADNYKAIASITNTNYFLNEEDVVYGDGEGEYIEITPIEVEIIYYTGTDSTSTTVNTLTYIDQSYIGHSNGLHARIHPDYTGKNVVDGHIYLSYDGDVKNVGVYNVTAYLDYLSSGNDSANFIISNYAVKNPTIQIEIVQRQISLEISTTRSFEYDITFNNINDINISCTKINNVAGDDTVALTKTIYYYDDNVKGDVATTTNVGRYLISFEIDSNNNYYLNTSTSEVSFEIYQYDISTSNRVELSPITDSYVYTGSNITPNINMSTFVRLDNGYYLTNEEHYEVSYSNNKDAGTTATVRVDGKGNYKGYLTTYFTISKRTLGVSFTSNSTLTYNGQDRTVSYVLTGVDEYAKADTIKNYTSVSYSATPHYVNANYVATVYFTNEQKNYKLSDNESDRQFTFAITPLDVSVVYSNTQDKVYNGQNQLVSVSCADFFGGDDVTIKDRYYSKSLKKYEDPKNVGFYDVVVELNGQQAKNYNITNATFLDYKITARPIKLDFTSSDYQKTYLAKDLSLVFNTDYSISTETPAVQGENTGIYLTYQPAEGAAINNGNLISVGTYSVLYSTQNTNYQLISSDVNPTITISPAELKLYVNNAVTTSEYRGVNSKINIPFDYTADGKPLGNDSFTPIRNYYNVDNPSLIFSTGIYEVGTYKMLFELPSDNPLTKNYVINADNLAEIQSFTYVITPRPISVEFNVSDSKVYNAQSIACTQQALLTITNGLLDGDTIAIDVEVTKDGEPVEEIRNVGRYTINFKLNDGTINYQLKSGSTTKKTYDVTAKAISFFANSFSKIYGNADAEIIQRVDGIEGESVIVTFNRETGEDVGYYNFYHNTLQIVQDGENELVAQNYSISFAGVTTEQTHGQYQIIPRSIDFNPDGDTSTEAIDPFYFDYLDPISSEKLIYRHPVDTALFGIITVEIQLAPKDPTIVNMGTYDLSIDKDDIVCLNKNFSCTMVEGGHIGKIVILGRSVQLKFDDIYITYGVEKEPNYYNYLTDVEVAKCDQNIQNDYNSYVAANGSADGFDWSKYIRITREQYSNSLGIELGYKENGYKLTIEFLNKDGIVDSNYRAVRLITNDDGTTSVTSTPARLYVNKFDLNTIYGDSTGLKKPDVAIEKNYDGKVLATITSTNILPEHELEQLSVYAEYDSAEAGEGNKTITVRYAFKIADFGNNYILPNDIVYTQTATIKPLTINAIIDQESIELTYGETPSITLSYEGFINDNSIYTEGIKLSGIYADGKALDSIKDVGSYSIKLKLDTCLTKNYVVNYQNASVTVTFSRKSIALVVGKPFEKAVDGTTDATITPENYVLEGLLEQDKNFVFIATEDITAMLNSAEPGSTFVRMSITELSGDKKGNYSLSNYELTIPAEIKKLADVTLASASYDFDNTQKGLVPVLENVLSGVKYYLEYTGITVQYATSRQAPKNAGTYKVVCYVHNEQGTYNRAMAEAELTINKITPNLYFTGTFVQTYGSFTPIEAAVKASGLEQQVNVTYSFVDEGGIFPAFPPAGKHTVKAEYDETANYLPVSAEKTLEIKAKSLSITFDNYKGLVYNGYSRENDITITFNGVVQGDKCTPVKLFNTDSVKNAGTYRLIVSPSNPSYVISGANSIEFTIAKKVLKVSVGNDVVTTAGVAPEFTMQYVGFVENEDESDLATAPSVRLTTGAVGVNRVKYNEGYDENYSFTYIDCVYTITYASENEGKTNYTPYIASGVTVGSIGGIFLIAYLVKIYNYRSMTKYVAKRTIKKAMFKSKNVK